MRGTLPGNRPFLLFSERQSEPNPEAGKDRCYQSAIDFRGMLDDQKAVLRPLQERDQYTSAQPVNQNVSPEPREVLAAEFIGRP